MKGNFIFLPLLLRTLGLFKPSSTSFGAKPFQRWAQSSLLHWTHHNIHSNQALKSQVWKSCKVFLYLKYLLYPCLHCEHNWILPSLIPTNKTRCHSKYTVLVYILIQWSWITISCQYLLNVKTYIEIDVLFQLNLHTCTVFNNNVFNTCITLEGSGQFNLQLKVMLLFQILPLTSPIILLYLIIFLDLSLSYTYLDISVTNYISRQTDVYSWSDTPSLAEELGWGHAIAITTSHPAILRWSGRFYCMVG